MKKIIVFFGGLFTICLGVALLLELNLGSDPFTVFTQGLANTLNITPGFANRIITLILLSILVIFSRKDIRIGCFLSLLFSGVLLDMNITMLAPLELASFNFASRICIFVIACITIGIGFPILKCADLGVAPNDLIYLILSDKLKKPYSHIRIAVDCIFLLIGVVLGGVVGIGTILCVALMGPIIQFFLKRVERLISPFLQVKAE